MENLLQQDYPKESLEIIFADGLSTDKTKDILLSYREKHSFIQVIDNPQRVVPHALNAAIKASSGEIIIRMDAHSIYPKNYWSVLVEKLDEYQADNVGGVWNTQPGADTLTAQAIALATSHPLGIGNAGYRLGVKEDKVVDTVPYGCFKKELFARIGFFDEQLLRNQDDEFNGRIIKSGGKIVLIPTLEITYFARETYRKLWTMFYQYGLFKPLVNVKLGAHVTLRQFAPPILVLSLILPLLLSSVVSTFFLLWLAVLMVYIIPIIIVSVRISIPHGIALYPYLLLAFPTIHFAYGLGYIFGIIKFIFFKRHKKMNPMDIKHNR